MRRLLAPWLLLCMLLPAAASGAAWTVDTAASKVAFVPTWEGAPFEGIIPHFSASIEFDAPAPEKGRFDITFDMRSADTGNEDMNEGMQMPEWFAVERFPEARYVTNAISATGKIEYRAAGQLTLKGVNRPVKLPFTWTQTGNRARLQGETLVKRLDFNIGEGEWASDDSIGLEVRIAVDLRLTRSE